MAIKIEGGNTVKGNAVGFTAAGETVTVCRRAKQKAYKVAVAGPFGPSSLDARNQTFPTLAEARTYAASLVDEAKTLELTWWHVKVV
jgi:hypothetical protein